MDSLCPRCGGAPIRANGAGHLGWCPTCIGVVMDVYEDDAPPDVLPLPSRVHQAPTFVPANSPTSSGAPGNGAQQQPQQSPRASLVAELAKGLIRNRRTFAEVRRWAEDVMERAEAAIQANLALRQRLDQAEADRDQARRELACTQAQVQLLQTQLAERR